MLTAWDWEPTVVVGCVGLLVAYAAAARFKFSKTALWFLAGVLVLMLSLVSPLDVLSDDYLFSAHMVQHMMLILVIPPFLLMGIPREMAQKALRYPWVQRAEALLSKPSIAWPAGMGTMWLWHWPPLYNAAVANVHIHVVEHMSFLVGATIFWWPVISPIEELRLKPLLAVAYTFTACMAHSVLGIILTFAPLGHFPEYMASADPYGILSIIRGQWGITPAVDQQWGGLVMWVPACMVFLAYILVTLARWYRRPERETVVAVPAAIASAKQGGRL